MFAARMNKRQWARTLEHDFRESVQNRPVTYTSALISTRNLAILINKEAPTNSRQGNMKSAFGYIRVSTQGQADEGISLEAQQAKIAAWCLVNDHELAGCFIDAGISGKRADNRPELQRALEAATETGGVLVVYSLSRLARSTKDTIAIGERLEKHGADLVSLSEQIDTTSAAGKMIFRMLAVMAEFERDLVSERTKSALSHKKAQGKRVGKIPFGWDLDEDGETLVENASEQEALQLIKKLRSKGQSLRAIAAELEAQSVTTKAGKAKWTHTAVQGILSRNAA